MPLVRSRRLLLGTLLLSLAACNQGALPDTFPGQPVTERNRIFKLMLRSFEPIGLMVRGKKTYNANEAIGHADELKRLSTLPWSHFPAGSNYAPTKAKTAIWEQPEEFKHAQENFVTAVDHLAAAARSRKEEELRSAHEALSQVCSSCHKAFRR